MSEQEAGNLLRKTKDLMKGQSIIATRSKSDYGYDIFYLGSPMDVGCHDVKR